MLKELITTKKFKLFAPTSKYEEIAPCLNVAANKYGIDTDREIRHWLAHLAVESAYFQRTVENLNYSAERLTKVWPSRFPNLASTGNYARNPKALANKVYGGRLGNDQPNDGYTYRGRGFIQLTGKANYAAASEAIGIDLVKNPDFAATYECAALIAGWYWKKHKLSEIVAIDPNEKEYVDRIKSVKENEIDDLIQGTKAINGGLIGLDERKIELLKAAYIWPD